MVSLVRDSTANIALFAIAAHADEREAHVREVERSGQNLCVPRISSMALTSRVALPAVRP